MMSVDSTYLLCCYYSIITKALEVLNEYCINSLSSHEEAVTSKYFSTEFVSQINFFYKSKFICSIWFKNLAWITYLNLVLMTQTKW